ncbi:hypothetical protein C8T65DRAFT_626470 [Cerioporus squamosus]|nr:hypothetical protein C8T65DRAFT_626470 [Cerioporus squamosus]
MPVSDIDAIFASKGKVAKAAAPPKASSSSSAQPEKKKKKKKSAKRKRDDDAEDAAPSPPLKRQVPETVFDPSAGLSSAKTTKPAKVERAVVKQKKPKKDREEEQRFKDSRGTGPRRTTEEGFLIYKEDELGIADSGGDTPLCPFDCQCCKLKPWSLVPVADALHRFLTVSIPCTAVAYRRYPQRANLCAARPHSFGSIEASPTASAMVVRGQCVAKIDIRIPRLRSCAVTST